MSLAGAWSRTLFDAVDVITTLVEQIHGAIARRPFDTAARVPGMTGAVEGVRGLHDGITAGVYAGVRTMSWVAGQAVGAALDLVPDPRDPSPTLDLATSAVNGAVGDHLERSNAELRIRMGFRRHGREVSLEPESLARDYPDATPRIAVLVHGLMANEHVWKFFARPDEDAERADYGGRLQQDLGYTPVYLRFNSGRHISENGRELAGLLDRLVTAWPVDVEQMTLIGHSMGGLVARSACYYGRRERLGWPALVDQVVCLGSPHRGSPVEKLANVATWILESFDETRALAALANGRSAGIKDLRFGYVTDEEWLGYEADELLHDRGQDVTLLETASHRFVAATIGADPRHPVSRVIGDALVRVTSAAGRDASARRSSLSAADVAYVGGISHLGLVNHPTVYDYLRGWLTSPDARPSTEPAAFSTDR